MISRSLVTTIAVILFSLATLACETVTPQQVADALLRATGLNPGLQSCAMAAMAMKESGGGNTCAGNSCCVGVLQLNVGPTGTNFTATERANYQNADLQTQVNGWVATANSNASSRGYRTLLEASRSRQGIGGHPVTPGMLAACEQFGAKVCNSDVQALQQSGSCAEGLTDGDGASGQTVCSWGAAADKQAGNQNCSMGDCNIDNVSDFPEQPLPPPVDQTMAG